MVCPTIFIYNLWYFILPYTAHSGAFSLRNTCWIEIKNIVVYLLTQS